MYVNSPKNPKVHLGQFINLNMTKWKFQSNSSCTKSGITGLPEATVTHAIPNPVPISKKFTWTGSDSEMNMDDLVLNVVIASNDAGHTGKAKWQHLAPISLFSNGTSTTSTMVAPASTSTPVTQSGASASQMSLLGFVAGLLFL